jgi:hypothetical protein
MHAHHRNQREMLGATSGAKSANLAQLGKQPQQTTSNLSDSEEITNGSPCYQEKQT